MTEKKSRSAFIPILVATMVMLAAATMMIMFVPFVDCGACGGRGTLLWLNDNPVPVDPRSLQGVTELTADSAIAAPCSMCNEDHKATLWQNWTYDPAADTFPVRDLSSPEIIELR